MDKRLDSAFAGEVEDMMGKRPIFLTVAVVLPLKSDGTECMLLAQENYYLDVRATDQTAEPLPLYAEDCISGNDEVVLSALVVGAPNVRIADAISATIENGKIAISVDNDRLNASGYSASLGFGASYATGASIDRAVPKALRIIATPEMRKQAEGMIVSYRDRLVTAEDGRGVPVCVVAHLEDLPSSGYEAMNDITCVDTAFDLSRVSSSLTKEEILNGWFLKPDE